MVLQNKKQTLSPNLPLEESPENSLAIKKKDVSSSLKVLKQWIVLIEKKPIGPISTENLLELLKQKVVRLNHFALALEGKDSSSRSEWKFLSQYPEFQKEQLDQKAQKPLILHSSVDSSPKSNEPISQEILDLIAKIPIEDLAFHSPTPEEKTPQDFEPEIISTHLKETSNALQTYFLPFFLLLSAVSLFLLPSFVQEKWSSFLETQNSPQILTQPKKIFPPKIKNKSSLNSVSKNKNEQIEDSLPIQRPIDKKLLEEKIAEQGAAFPSQKQSFIEEERERIRRKERDKELDQEQERERDREREREEWSEDEEEYQEQGEEFLEEEYDPSRRSSMPHSPQKNVEKRYYKRQGERNQNSSRKNNQRQNEEEDFQE